jgi:MATE family multidrug resistance protein
MSTWLQENRKTLTLAVPLIVGQVSQMLLGLTDTLMIGRVGTVDLAAAALGNALIFLPFALAIGLAVAVSIQVSHHHGSESRSGVAETLRSSLAIALLLGSVLAGLVAASVPYLGYLKQPPEVLAIVPPYLYWVGASFLAMVPTMVIKSFAEAQTQPWVAFWIQLAGVGLNVVLNAILIFGYLGAPALGLTGAGIATFIARVLTLVGLWLYLNRSRRLAPSVPKRWLQWPAFAECVSLAKIASPVSGQMLIEIGAFAMGAFLIGRLGAVPLAAHQIAVTCATTTFMLPLGLAMAVTIRVGHAASAGSLRRCRSIVIGAQVIGFGIMATCALSYVTLGEWIGAAFTIDAEVVALTGSLLTIVAIFQIFDGVQVISSAGLRGLRDVNVPTVFLFVCFWLLAIPLGGFLGLAKGFGAAGVWIGLAAGLGLASVLLSLRLKHKLASAGLGD